MKKIIPGITAFLFAAAFLTFFWWLCGFNFDHRGPEVGLFFVISTAACVCAGVVVMLWNDD